MGNRGWGVMRTTKLGQFKSLPLLPNTLQNQVHGQGNVLDVLPQESVLLSKHDTRALVAPQPDSQTE